MQLMSPAHRLAITGAAVLLSLGLSACGNDDAEDATVPLEEWVDAFDAKCVELAEQVTPETTDEEFAAVSDQALAEMRELLPPDEKADVTAELLDIIEESSDPDVDEADIEELDSRAMDALTELEVSVACLGGVDS